jgi:hypothetical protein
MYTLFNPCLLYKSVSLSPLPTSHCHHFHHCLPPLTPLTPLSLTQTTTTRPAHHWPLLIPTSVSHMLLQPQQMGAILEILALLSPSHQALSQTNNKRKQISWMEYDNELTPHHLQGHWCNHHGGEPMPIFLSWGPLYSAIIELNLATAVMVLLYCELLDSRKTGRAKI